MEGTVQSQLPAVQAKVEPVELSKIRVEDIVHPIEIKNLIVSPMTRLSLAMGDIESLLQVSNEMEIKGIVWNERGISLLTDDRNTSIVFRPEIQENVEMFFEREGKKEKGNIWEGTQTVWEGDCGAVVFSKRNLLAFIKQNKALITKETEDAIKNLKVSETKSQNEQMLDIDSDDQVTITEERSVTNIPKQFTIHMLVAPGMSADLIFEAKVADLKNDYGHNSGKKGIQLRCINARSVMHDMMQGYVKQLPAEIPRYYGAMLLGEPNKRGY